MNKYKTLEELKEELGDKLEDYMYNANIELLKQIDEIRRIIENKNITGIEARLMIQDILEDKYE
jgi:NTP pyrophosphatase (non-canonical NTP hydrolase)